MEKMTEANNRAGRPLKNFKELIVWRKAYALSLEIYHITEKYPAREIYGISSQMRRAAVSIVSNIAEGYGREHRKEYLQYLSVARGSAAELETQLLLSQDLGFLSETEGQNQTSQLDEIQKMLFAMIQKLNIRKSS